MTGFLLDTNCISELVRPKPDPGVINWLTAVNEELTFGQIRKGLDLDLQTRFQGEFCRSMSP